MSSSPTVVYLRDDSASRYDLAVQSPQHPMKPWRLTAVHALVRRLGLFHRKKKKMKHDQQVADDDFESGDLLMQVLTPPPVPAEVMNDFHFNEYVGDLEKTSGDSWLWSSSGAAATGAGGTSGSSTTTTAAAAGGQHEWRPLSERLKPAAAADNSTTSEQLQQQNQQQHAGQRRSTRPAAAEPAPSCFSPYDCPVVQGGLEYSRIVAGSSLFGAVLLNTGAADIVINWAGGMHHARAGSCSGFCYVNDCVIAIRELLRRHRRVMYIDIDVHHGDGVEEAFYDTDKVFTLSLHKFCDGFFPGTGHPADVGVDRGRYFSLNVPLRDGVRDEEYLELFGAAFRGVTAAYDPEAVVLQCGADSLAGDRLGGTALRLSSEGHAACVRMVREYCVGISSSSSSSSSSEKKKKPLLVLGGGGYSVRHLSRLWAYETAVLCGVDDEVHSRMTVPLPTRSLLSTKQEDEGAATSMWRLLELLKSSAAASEASNGERAVPKPTLDLTAVQLELEERSLILVFSDEQLVVVPNADDDNDGGGGGGGDEERNTTTSSKLPPTCSLFVPCDGGGFETRQHGNLIGPGALYRFVQTVTRQIQNHTLMLEDAVRKNNTNNNIRQR